MKSGFALLPPSASTVARDVDWLTTGLLVLCGLIVLLVFGLIFTFAIRYHHTAETNRKIRKNGQWIIEWGWTFATFGAFLSLFAWGAVLYLKMRVAPAGAMEISVIGKQWMWKFQHPDGRRELNELHVPVGKPVLLTMTSQDVIHSLFVPAFRIKQDVLPDRYVHQWFEATRTGEYHLFCTQYCGTAHAEMRGRVIVLSEEDFQRWQQTGLDKASLQTAGRTASRGARIFAQHGCTSCHGEGAAIRAPDLHGIFGKPAVLSDGTAVTADENYIRESILNPGAKIVKGYPNIMPPFAGQLSEEDVLDLIAYIKGNLSQ